MVIFRYVFNTIIILCLLAVPLKLKDFPVFPDLEPEIHSEVKCLAENIYHEAKGESLRGKFGVAQVTVNRTQSKYFPSNVCDVVYERNRKVCQFSWTCKGLQVKIDDQYEDSLAVAYAVLVNGVEVKSLRKALFYHADYTDPKWKRKRIHKIGRHIFYS